MKIFLSAGEPSGDLHAANLVRAIREIRPDAEIVGFGGDHLEAAGVKPLFRLTDLAVMWFGRVLLNLHKFIEQANRADRYFRDEKPDVLVLIDFPGFHWALAKRAAARGIPVVYYVPPQLWAWAGWRVEKVRKWVDRVLCSLPFEPKWYHDRGIEQAEFIGHPYFDELAERELDQEFVTQQNALQGRVVALLPGSRTQEVKRNFPLMLKAASKIAADSPDIRFVVSCLHEKHQRLADDLMRETGIRFDNLAMHAGKTAELIRVAHAAIAVSGSVGLELMVEALPTVVVYKVRRLDLVVARRFIRTRFISLVNLLADEGVMPEFLTDQDVSGEMAGCVSRWLQNPAERERASRKLADLRDRVAVPGASSRAAGRIVELIEGRTAALHGPHSSLTEAARAASRPTPDRD